MNHFLYDDENPCFINSLGDKFYLLESATRYARSSSISRLKYITALVVHYVNGEKSFILIEHLKNDEVNVLWEGSNFESLGSAIDALKTVKKFKKTRGLTNEQTLVTRRRISLL